MQHRHLLPDEVDQLLDGASGLDAAPLRAHLAGCPDCTRQLADARIVCDALDALQHLAPSPRFTASVMAQVQVLEPWHVALANGAQRLLPASRPMRMVMLASGALVAVALSATAIGLAMRPDLALYAAGLAAGRARGALLDAAGTLIHDVFGQTALEALRSGGGSTVALGGAVLLTAVAVASVGLRAAATTARRTRE